MSVNLFHPNPIRLCQEIEPNATSGSNSTNEINRRSFLKRTGGATVATLVAWNMATRDANAETQAVSTKSSGTGSGELEYTLMCLKDPASAGATVSARAGTMATFLMQRARHLANEPDEQWGVLDLEFDNDRSALRQVLTGTGPIEGALSGSFIFEGGVYGSESDEWNEYWNSGNSNDWANSDVTDAHDDSDPDDICAKGKLLVPPVTLSVEQTGPQSYKVVWSPTHSKIMKLRCPLNRFVAPNEPEAAYIADLDISGVFITKSNLQIKGCVGAKLSTITGSTTFTIGSKISRNSKGEVEIGIPEVGTANIGGGTGSEITSGLSESLTVIQPSIDQIILLNLIWDIWVGARIKGSTEKYRPIAPAIHDNIVTYIEETATDRL